MCKVNDGKKRVRSDSLKRNECKWKSGSLRVTFCCPLVLVNGLSEAEVCCLCCVSDPGVELLKTKVKLS